VEIRGVELRRRVVTFENKLVVLVGSGFEKSALEDAPDDVVKEAAGRCKR